MYLARAERKDPAPEIPSGDREPVEPLVFELLRLEACQRRLAEDLNASRDQRRAVRERIDDINTRLDDLYAALAGLTDPSEEPRGSASVYAGVKAVSQ